MSQTVERKAEWLGNDNRKPMVKVKVKNIGQILPFKNGTALPSPSPAPGSPFFTSESMPLCVVRSSFRTLSAVST